MALGGGNYLNQNKVLPGTYINYISSARAQVNLSDRGVVAVPMHLNWGKDNEVFRVSAEEFQRESLELFGYDYTAPELRELREIFKNAKEVLFYKLNGGSKATATFETLTVNSKYKGIRGNDIKIVISKNIDSTNNKNVETYLGNHLVDLQIVKNAEELVPNKFVDFGGLGLIIETAGFNLSGGSNAVITGAEHQAALDKLESFGFNVLICPSSDKVTTDLYVAYTKRMRDDIGAKFQTVVYRNDADYEGVITVENTIKNSNSNPYSLVYWVGGLQASAAINASTTNKMYDGEFDINVDYKQSELSSNILQGKFMLHRVNGSIRVLSDINSYVSYKEGKNSDFSSNQVIRVFDNIANDIALLFNTKYLGSIQNDSTGRVSLWSDIVAYNRQLESLKAIQNFIPDEIIVKAGNEKNSVVVINPVEVAVAMEKLYMTVLVS